MDQRAILNKVKNSATPVLERNDVEFAGIFGSYARGEAKKNSDIDFLIRFRQPKSLLELVRVELELSDALQTKVDLVTEKALCRHIRNRVMADLQPIYGAR